MADDNKTPNATSTAKPAAAEPTKAAAPAEAKPAAKAPAKPRTVKAPTIRRPAVRRTAVKAAAPAAKEPSLKEVSLDDPSLYINRDISWIEFDRKVLETAMDPEIPLLNRVLFLSIFYNNLDEFFMVRVMNVQRQARSGAEPTGPDKMPPARQLSEIRRKVTEILEEAENLWIDTLKPELETKGIRFAKYSALNAAQKKEMNRYFDEDIFPVLTPQAVDKGRPFPMISNTSLNFVMELEAVESGVSVKNRFARLKCPNNVPRFLFVSNKDNTVTPDLSYATTDGVIVLTEDLIGNRLNTLFPGYKVKSQGLFRITRNTDGESEEDEADDLLSAVRDYVEQRRFGSIVRVEIEKGMPQRLQDFLYEHLDLHPNQFYRCRVPLAFSEFGRMMKIDRPSLKYPADHPKTPKAFEPGRNCFDEIRKRDAELTAGAAQHADGLDLLGAGVVGDLQIAFLLNHSGTSLLRLLDDLNHAPSLILGQRTGLHDLYSVPDAAGVVLVMGLEFVGSLDDLLIQGMCHTVGNGHHHGLIHLIRNHQADSGLTGRSSVFRHDSVPPYWPASCCSRIMVLTLAMSRFTSLMRTGFSS